MMLSTYPSSTLPESHEVFTLEPRQHHIFQLHILLPPIISAEGESSRVVFCMFVACMALKWAINYGATYATRDDESREALGDDKTQSPITPIYAAFDIPRDAVIAPNTIVSSYAGVAFLRDADASKKGDKFVLLAGCWGCRSPRDTSDAAVNDNEPNTLNLFQRMTKTDCANILLNFNRVSDLIDFSNQAETIGEFSLKTEIDQLRRCFRTRQPNLIIYPTNSPFGIAIGTYFCALYQLGIDQELVISLKSFLLFFRPTNFSFAAIVDLREAIKHSTLQTPLTLLFPLMQGYDSSFNMLPTKKQR
jgi:hypothetical protein